MKNHPSSFGDTWLQSEIDKLSPWEVSQQEYNRLILKNRLWLFRLPWEKRIKWDFKLVNCDDEKISEIISEIFLFIMISNPPTYILYFIIYNSSMILIFSILVHFLSSIST